MSAGGGRPQASPGLLAECWRLSGQRIAPRDKAAHAEWQRAVAALLSRAGTTPDLRLIARLLTLGPTQVKRGRPPYEDGLRRAIPVMRRYSAGMISEREAVAELLRQRGHRAPTSANIQNHAATLRRYMRDLGWLRRHPDLSHIEQKKSGICFALWHRPPAEERAALLAKLHALDARIHAIKSADAKRRTTRL